jgi:hypothetical protein
MRPLWRDPRWAGLPQRPWRKVHLDYHNSAHLPRLAGAFDADAFAATLAAAHVTAVVVFAKDMHGYCYYPSALGPVHPGLSFDLLGAQVAACRARGIAVYAYQCVTWDNLCAEEHPEWLVFRRDRTTYLPRFDETPGWTALCLNQPGFVARVLGHSAEILQHYAIDGIWYDMPLPIGGECFCARCLATLRAAGHDPLDVAVQRHHKQQLLVGFLQQAQHQAQALRPGCQVDHNNQTRLGLGERAAWLDNIDIEALPTAFWGYWYFPTNVRYARTFGRTVYGMTGRFQRAWADFGGLKHPLQLRAEMAGIVAHGARCDIGDQLPPDGRLEPAVYATIGAAFAEVARLEPWLDGAVPVTEAALLVDGLPLEDLSTVPDAHGAGRGAPSVYGLTRLLMECQIQFDIVEPAVAWERYRLIILADELVVDAALARRLHAFLAGGGAVLAAHHALRGADGRAWHPAIDDAGDSPFTPAYMRLSEPPAGMPPYDYALYEGSARWRAVGADRVLGWLGEPLFQRTAQHYTSHAQTPCDHLTDYAAALVSGGLAASAFPIGASYFRHGYWIYRTLFRQLLQAVYATPLVVTSAPLSCEVTVTWQPAAGQRPARWLVHLVHFSFNRRGPDHCEFAEDPVPLHDVRVALAVDEPIVRAGVAGAAAALPLARRDGRWCVSVPQVTISAIVVFEAAAPGAVTA